MKEKYINEYGDILLPNDPILKKYQQIIHSNHNSTFDDYEMVDILNNYSIMFKMKRDNLKNKNNSNLILDTFKKLYCKKSE